MLHVAQVWWHSTLAQGGWLTGAGVARLVVAGGTGGGAGAKEADEELFSRTRHAVVGAELVAGETAGVARVAEVVDRVLVVVVGTARPALVESRHEDEAVLAGETVVVAAARAGRAVGVARCVSHPLSPTEADAALQVSAGRALGHTGSRLVVQIERALARETVVVGGSVAGGAVVTAGPTDRVLLEVAGVALGPAGRAIGDGEQLGGTGETFFVGAARAGGAHPVALETLGSDLVGAGGAGVRDALREVRDEEVGGLAGGARVVFVRDAGLALVVAGFAVGERRRVEARAALLNAHLELRHELFADRALQTVAGAGPVAPLARLVAVCLSSVLTHAVVVAQLHLVGIALKRALFVPRIVKQLGVVRLGLESAVVTVGIVHVALHLQHPHPHPHPLFRSQGALFYSTLSYPS